jgi:hypothetical protein
VSEIKEYCIVSSCFRSFYIRRIQYLLRLFILLYPLHLLYLRFSQAIYLQCTKTKKPSPRPTHQKKSNKDLQNILGGGTTKSEPVLDYIQDLDTRLRIFDELNSVSVDPWNCLIVAIFSIVMVAPITTLEGILRQVRGLAEANDRLAINCVFGSLQCFAEDGIEACSFLLSTAPSFSLFNPLFVNII